MIMVIGDDYGDDCDREDDHDDGRNCDHPYVDGDVGTASDLFVCVC
jgi:hypothetical protein